MKRWEKEMPNEPCEGAMCLDRSDPPEAVCKSCWLKWLEEQAREALHHA
jgi:hypothetical protein